MCARALTGGGSVLNSLEVVAGRVYRAKKPAHSNGCVNDRQVLWVGADGTLVQYDSPSVGYGRSYPTVTMGAFITWAGSDVTDIYKGRDWIPWAEYLESKKCKKPK